MTSRAQLPSDPPLPLSCTHSPSHHLITSSEKQPEPFLLNYLHPTRISEKIQMPQAGFWRRRGKWSSKTWSRRDMWSKEQSSASSGPQSAPVSPLAAGKQAASVLQGRRRVNVCSNICIFLTPTKIPVAKLWEQHFLTWHESSSASGKLSADL